MNDDWISLITRGISWLVLFAQLAIAVAAVARLKVSASGVLVALGFGGLAMTSLFHRMVWSFYIRPALDEGAYYEIETSMTALSLLTSFGAMLFWVLVGIGAVLIPSSLKRRRAGPAPG